MLLPPELLTLVFLTGLTAVHAQVNNTTAPTYISTPDTASIVTTPTTAPPLSPTGDSNDIGAPSPTLTIDEPPEPTEVDVCELPDPPDWCTEPPPEFWHPEETATGWDDWASFNDNLGGGNNLAPPTQDLKPVVPTPDVVTTVTPTVIAIRTSVQSFAPGVEEGATLQPQVPNTRPVGDGNKPQQNPGQVAPQTKARASDDTPGGSQVRENPAQPTPGLVAPTAPAPGAPAPEQSTAGPKSNTQNVPAQGQSALTGNALLDTIINHLGKAQPGAQPSQPAQTTQPIVTVTGGFGEGLTPDSTVTATEAAKPGPGDSAKGWEDASGQATPDAAQTASGQDSIAVGNTITLGSATISLTAGLSTVVGTGTDTTLIAIQTDSASQTVITISSSGTAITATITNAPATVTLPKTGFEASITDSAGRGVGTSRIPVTAVSTSSKGAAVRQHAPLSALSGFIVWLLGFLATI